MLINEKVIRLFARSILFENTESFNITEAMYSPSAGGIGTGANDLYKVPPSFNKPKEPKTWQEKDLDVINVDNTSSIQNSEIEDLSSEELYNVSDFKKKVNNKIGNIGIDISNDNLNSAYKKIEKIIGDML